MTSITIRDATASDADIIADLHAGSWRSAYRGIMSDDFLDQDVFEDRRSVWRRRMADGRFIVLLAESDGAPVGFAGYAPDVDPKWGTLLDNLHVEPSHKGHGIGFRLFGAGAARMLRGRPAAGIHLTVYAANEPAIAFYERLGGVRIETTSNAPGAVAGKLAHRYFWPAEALARLVAQNGVHHGMME